MRIGEFLIVASAGKRIEIVANACMIKDLYHLNISGGQDKKFYA